MDKKFNANLLILAWFYNNKRELPWRKTKDPYKIWLSEIILQQTRVDQGKAYYERFVANFPTVKDLAFADEIEVLKLWQGLGYYSRARNLHFTAKTIVNDYNSVFPHTFSELKKLKGIGDYTAAAISSICFNEAVPAVDGNMFRVFSRYFGIYDDIALAKTKNVFFNLGLEVIDSKNSGDYNQAIMDLGATICTPKNYQCNLCPLNNSCFALQRNVQNQLPIKSKKIKIRERFFHFILIKSRSEFLITKRISNDVWRNLYTLPLIESKNKNLDSENLNQLSISNKELVFLYDEKHILSHQRLYISFWELIIDHEQFKEIAQNHDLEIVTKNQLETYPLPKPIEKFMNFNKFV